jgi:hypothetical protein
MGGDSPGARRPFPSVSDVAAVSANGEPVLRNLQITQAYHELSVALAAHTGPTANWCTFATWASKQAGQSIRGEDLARKVEHVLGAPGGLQEAWFKRQWRARRLGPASEARVLRAAMRQAFPAGDVLRRVADAVARGNKKVFEEIGREFARFLEVLQDHPAPDPAQIDRFARGLRPGGPPDGQDLLAGAFASYGRALCETDAKARAELMLLANLRAGLHEQIRLQPEIVEALEAPVADPGALKERLTDVLLGHADRPANLRMRPSLLLGRSAVVEAVSVELAADFRRRVRSLITEELMTLELPSGRLRLGSDVPAPFPGSLQTIENAELLSLLNAIDPTPDSRRESAAEDWGDLDDRIHFIADLFRAGQEDPSLFAAPYTPEQAEAISSGRIPSGRL